MIELFETMMPGLLFSSFLGLLGCTIAFMAAFFTVWRPETLSTGARFAILVGLFLVLLLPIGDESLVIYLRGFVGDLSVATLMISGVLLVNLFNKSPLLSARSRSVFWNIIIITALLFYPFALGIGPFDPYQLGYSDRYFQWVILGLGFLMMFARYYLVAIWFALSLLAYQFELYESRNLWDYLLDPLISLVAIVGGLRCGFKILVRYYSGFNK